MECIGGTTAGSITRRDQREAEDHTLSVEWLYERYGRIAFALAYRIIGNPEAAEDIVQEAFLSVWRNSHAVRQAQLHLQPWLMTVVRNRAIDAVRAQRSRPVTYAARETLISTGHDSDPADVALRRIDAAAVRIAVASLPDVQRDAVVLAYFAGLSYPEVAARMGTPLGTVKSRIRLAINRLQEVLLREGEPEWSISPA